MKIAICDTDLRTSSIVEGFIAKQLEQKNESYFGEKFESAIELLDAISFNSDFDACFLRAEMSGMNGIDVAKEVKKYRPSCMVILYAATDSYAISAWNVDAFFYLLMPATGKEISNILDRIQERINSTDRSFLRIKLKDGWYHILYRNILYLESDAHKVNISLTDHTQVAAYGKLDRFEEVLSESNSFIRIHKSVLIHGKYIKKFSAQEVICEDGAVFNLSRNAIERAKQQYERYVSKLKAVSVE